MLSGGKTLSISFIAEKIKVSIKKVRKVIVLLEEEGYVVREPIKDEHGSYKGWNYFVFAEPVSKDKRSHAGKKTDFDESGLDQNRTSPLKDKTEIGKENINIDNPISININKTEEEVNKKESVKENVPDGTAPTQEEQTFIVKMKERFPRIMRMEQPLTLKQAKKLKEDYDTDLLAKIMDEVENWRPLIKNKVSAYSVIRNWCNREKDRL